MLLKLMIDVYSSEIMRKAIISYFTSEQCNLKQYIIIITIHITSIIRFE